MKARCLLLAALLCLVPAAEARRVALVIGNANYAHAGRLGHPIADAALIEDALRKAGFTTVDTEADMDGEAMRKALSRFSAQAEGAEVALIYYAGHGIEARGSNWLLPVDAYLEHEKDLTFQAINMESVLDATEGAKIRMVVLDACRDNPLGRSWGTGSRDVQQGLAEINANNVLVIYAAAPGHVASDGPGSDHSPFAAALARRLPEPGMELHVLGSKIRDDVLRATDNLQAPYVSASISGDPFVFVQGNVTVNVTPAPTAPPSAPAFDPRLADIAMWNSIGSSNDAGLLNAYLAQYPNGMFASMAKAKIAALTRPAPVAAPLPTAPAPAALAPAAPSGVFKDCDDGCPAMVRIAPGSFMMGTPDSEPGRYGGERPVHQVTIGYTFAVGEYPVTVAQFAKFVAETGYDAGSQCNTFQGGQYGLHDGRNWRSPDFAQGDDHPVVCVNWSDAQAYVAWLSRKTGQSYRLLSEAEYEYVNRAGTSTAYWWGDDADAACSYANGADLDIKAAVPNATTVNCHDGYTYTSPVGHFRPNGFGLHDTTGDVWSWVQDCYADSYGATPTNGSAMNGGNCGLRVVRGGSWNDDPRDLRSGTRDGYSADVRLNAVGFRVARTL